MQPKTTYAGEKYHILTIENDVRDIVVIDVLGEGGTCDFWALDIETCVAEPYFWSMLKSAEEIPPYIPMHAPIEVK